MKENPIVKTPVEQNGYGWTQIGLEEINAVTSLLQNPSKLFRYQGQDGGECTAFEREACEKTGIKHALFVNSGTSAIVCCLAALGIGPGDEVIVPAYTYIASAAAVTAVGAVPVIAEIDDSLSLDPEDVIKKITPQTKAVIMVHMQGVVGRLDRMIEVAKENNIYVIEDACQAIGSMYKGQYTGAKSDACAWSLNFFKIITCGESGVFFTNDDAAFLRGVYQSDPATPMWDSELKGDLGIAPFSKEGYRGNEISGAIARVQLCKLDNILGHTRKLKKLLIELLNEPINYKPQYIEDPEGDCGISFAMIANSPEIAKKFSKELSEEGLELGSVYNEGYPDRHIFSYWDSIMQKTGANDAGYPWKDPSYKGNVNYSIDSCPVTLDYLSRCLKISIHMGINETHIREYAMAINEVDKRL